MGSENKVYPNVEYASASDECANVLNREKILEMNNKLEDLNKILFHYVKLKKRWNKINNIVKITGLSLAGTTIVLGGFISSGIVLPLSIVAVSASSITTSSMIVGSMLAGLSAADLLISKITTSAFTSKKKKYYENKVLIIKSYIDKCYIYVEKSRNDNVITIEEIEGFRKLVHDLDKELSIGKSNVDMKTLVNEVKIEAEKKYGNDLKQNLKKELTEEYKNILKNEYKSELYK